MTIDEAIKYAEKVAEEQEKLCKRYPNAVGYTHWLEYAEKHRQLAEWLKDYKRLLEQEPVIDKIRAEIEEQVLESLSDGGDDWFTAEKVNECLEIIDKYKAESEVEE